MTRHHQLFPITCRTCGRNYNGYFANWCKCLTAEPSLLCPHCLDCFCSAPGIFVQNFWTNAPEWLRNRRKAHTKVHMEKQSFQKGDEIRRPFVLVVDDTPLIRLTATKTIESLGYGTISASNGMEGLEAARRCRPDLVLSDALMPGMDGREMGAKIKELKNCVGTKIVIMTSVYKSNNYQREATGKFGADEYVLKPLSSAELQALLLRHVGPPKTR